LWDMVSIICEPIRMAHMLLCRSIISRTVIADLVRMAPMLLCKLEKIFPLGFFNPMHNLILHLPYEARMGGPCRDVGAIQS
jgi:hypothetical protein